MSLRDYRRSDIWNYYDAIDEHYAICRTCLARISYKTTTSNLKKHLQCKHPHIVNNFKGTTELDEQKPNIACSTIPVGKQYELYEDESLCQQKRRKWSIPNNSSMSFLGDDSEIQVVHENTDVDWGLSYAPDTTIHDASMHEMTDLDYEENVDNRLMDNMENGFLDNIEPIGTIESMESLLTPTLKRSGSKRKSTTYIQPKTTDNINAHIKEKLLRGEYYIADIKGRSKVWLSFGILLDANGQQVPNVVACKTCKNILKTTHVGCTSNLAKHRCCRESIGQHKFPSQERAVVQEHVLTQHEDHKLDIFIKFLCRWSIKNNRCLKIINDSGFKKLIDYVLKVGKMFAITDQILPNLPVLSKKIDFLYINHLIKLNNYLSCVNWKCASMSVDIWSDEMLSFSILIINIHYLEDNQVTTRLLGVAEIDKNPLTRKSALEKFTQLLNQYNGKENQKYFITTQKKFITDTFENENLILCMNYYTDKMLDSVFSDNEYLQKLSKTFYELSEILIESGFKNNICQAKTKNKSKWYNFIILYDYIEANWVDLTSILLEKDEMFRIQELNLNLVKKIIIMLKNFEVKYNMLQDIRKPTLHLPFLHIESFRQFCFKEDTDSKLELDMKKKLLKNIDETLSPIITIYHKIATFLYPPGRKLLSQQDKYLVKKEILKLMKNILEILDDVGSQFEEINDEDRELFGDFLDDSIYKPADEKINHELHKYENYNCLNFQHDDMILQWWEENKFYFPLLAKFVKIFFVIPATSVSTNIIINKLKVLYSSSSDQFQNNFKEIILLHCNQENLSNHMYSSNFKVSDNLGRDSYEDEVHIFNSSFIPNVKFEPNFSIKSENSFNDNFYE